MIGAEVKAAIDASVLCWLASVDPEGMPNVTPKEIFTSHGDDHLVVADIASAGSVRNIRANAQMCVSFVDVFRQTGFKVKGRGRVIGRDETGFAFYGAELMRMAEPAFPIRHVIVMAIENVTPIVAPSYRLLPDLSEEARMAEAYAAYGVRPLR